MTNQTENMVIWNSLKTTDPAHTKGFTRAGGFKGTAIKPIYTEQKMTEVFGPAGLGWGMGEPCFQVVPGSDGQVAVFCTVMLWWSTAPDQRANQVYGVGGDMVVVKQSAGLRTDDEAFKKAFTDAVGNAMKHLGMSADVHMGLFDDSKYVESIKDTKANSRGPYAELEAEVDACTEYDQLPMLWKSKAFQDRFTKLPVDFQDELIERFNVSLALLKKKPAAVSPQESLDRLGGKE